MKIETFQATKYRMIPAIRKHISYDAIADRTVAYQWYLPPVGNRRFKIAQ